ncbi:MAG: DUF4168 domain-containing protein [Nitrincola lacisaponensis]|uniref:DUF4168 domain-containing protein n=1 Tax=Nitrincola lacisaponensis TaxID=267850 RepID=A0A063Y5Q2_9GAMM|nr:DUF4168 domain-containing protein [Nitrincola lacisaponensis]KDE40979.1 hypothetical protein ADINL_0628 [Nitrincola lacisaponensis]
MKKTLLATAFASLMTLGFASHTLAYETQSGMAAPQQGQVEFAESDLQTFAAVQGDLDNIRADYSARLESTSDQEQAAELQQEASQMMIEAVEAAGMDVETYNTIALALQSDPELRDQVAEMLN